MDPKHYSPKRLDFSKLELDYLTVNEHTQSSSPTTTAEALQRRAQSVNIHTFYDIYPPTYPPIHLLNRCQFTHPPHQFMHVSTRLFHPPRFVLVPFATQRYTRTPGQSDRTTSPLKGLKRLLVANMHADTRRRLAKARIAPPPLSSQQQRDPAQAQTNYLQSLFGGGGGGGGGSGGGFDDGDRDRFTSFDGKLPPVPDLKAIPLKGPPVALARAWECVHEYK